MKSYCPFKTLALIALMLLSFSAGAQTVTFKSKDLSMSVGQDGRYKSVKVCGKEILSDRSPVIIGLAGGEVIMPSSLTRNGRALAVVMEDGRTVELSVDQARNSINITAGKVPSEYSAVMFGPVKVRIHDVVGDVVGVVQGEDVAFAMQALNIKTNAGIPEEYIDAVQGKFYSSENSNGARLSVGLVPNNRLAAVDLTDGSLMQISARNRSRLEYRTVRNVKNSMVLPVDGPDGLIEGAKVAVWGSKATEALSRIGDVEIEQGLPHPMFNGEWGKTSRQAMRSYLISDFDENNFDFVLSKVELAGMKYLYHDEPFKNWGHFELLDNVVSNGDEGLKALADKAAQKGIQLGLHTLSCFTTTNDPYVTPVPDAHLLKQAALELMEPLDPSQTEIRIKDNTFFAEPATLNALQIDDELITFTKATSDGAVMTLTGCTRGAFGTAASSHGQSTPLYKLWDYPYKTLYPDVELQDAFALRLADLFNKTGVAQTSLDGLEGCLSTGQDDYATARFVAGIFDNVDHNVLNDASNLNHFTWHYATRMNWGEPWGEAMRTGQVESRIKNQEFFRRNLFPRMLGWFLIRLADRKFECSTLEDLEWALSESAGFDAGYAMTIRPKTLYRHGQIDVLLEAMKNWDMLRENMCFTPEQMERLKDPATEWHLEKVSDSDFNLYPLNISRHFRCNLSELQPGQPGGSDWNIDNPYAGKFSFRLKVEGDGSISNPSFYTDQGTVSFKCTVAEGQYLLYGWDGKAYVTDKNYNVVSEAEVMGSSQLGSGNVHVGFACDRDKYDSPEVDVRFITRGTPETVILRK